MSTEFMAATSGAGGHPASGTALRGLTKASYQVAALATAQVATYAFPVAFAVVCARNLGPSQYGVISFYTALTAFLCMFIEFGFDSIGVREVHSSGERAHAERVIWNVTLAKLVICLPTCLVALPVLHATRPADGSPVIWAMAIYMLGFALEPSWYLRSLQFMGSVMLVAVVSRFAGVILLVAVVTGQHDLARAMWAYAFVAWASSIVGWIAMRHLRVLGRPRFDLPHLHTLFRSGAAIVLGNISGTSLNSAGIAVLGAIADPVVTGAANMALRIRIAALAVLVPLGQVGFVRLSSLIGVNPAAAVAFGRRLFYLMMVCSVALALLISSHADRIAALIYGLPQAPEVAGALVRLLALGLPACIAAGLFGLQGLTLFRQERAYVLVSVAAALIFFGLLVVLHHVTSSNFGWALLAADVWTAVAAGLFLRRSAKSHATA